MNSQFTGFIYRELGMLSLFLGTAATFIPLDSEFSLNEKVSIFLLGLIAYAVFSCAVELNKRSSK